MPRGTEQKGEELADVEDDRATELANLISVKPGHNDKRPGRGARTYRRISVQQGWNVTHLVELEGIEPSSAECSPSVLRPFPVTGLTLPSGRVTNTRHVFP